MKDTHFLTVMIIFWILIGAALFAFRGRDEASARSTSTPRNVRGYSLFDVKNVFSERCNEDDRQYLLSDIKVQQGCFTGSSPPEAIASFRDHNQCHAAGYSEVWLLRFDGNWQAVRKLADHDRCRFRLVDLEDDGRDEIWIESRGGNQGQFFAQGELLAFRDATPHTLYSNNGRDWGGACREGLASHSHEVSFADVDKDGTLELVDKEEKSWFAWTGRK